MAVKNASKLSSISCGLFSLTHRLCMVTVTPVIQNSQRQIVLRNIKQELKRPFSRPFSQDFTRIRCTMNSLVVDAMLFFGLVNQIVVSFQQQMRERDTLAFIMEEKWKFMQLVFSWCGVNLYSVQFWMSGEDSAIVIFRSAEQSSTSVKLARLRRHKGIAHV